MLNLKFSDMTPPFVFIKIIPDSCLRSVEVLFTSPAGNFYSSLHQRALSERDRNRRLAPYMLQRVDVTKITGERDLDELRNVGAVIGYVTGGRIDYTVGDDRLALELPKDFSQEDVIHWLWGYKSHFHDVRIGNVSYRNVPNELIEHPDIDRSKLLSAIS